jgi:hypothetical protein
MKNIKFLKIISLSIMLSGIGLYLGSCSNKKDDIYTNLNIMKLEISSDKQLEELEYFNKNIKELILNEGITKIPKKAFMNNLIEEITIPNSVQEISDYAFEGNRINKINIDSEKSNLKKIGKSAFGYISISELKLNRKLEEISEESFKNSNISVVDLSLCENLKLIPKEAFYNSSITSLKLNQNIEEVGELAFMENGIQSFSVPENLKVVRKNAFNSNNISNKFEFNNLEIIEDGAFQTNKINKIHINTNKIKNIGKDAFANQREIEYIDINIKENLEFKLEKKLNRPFGTKYYLSDEIIEKLNIVKAEDYIEIKENKILGFKKDVNIEEYFELTNNGTFKRAIKIPFIESIDTISKEAFKDLEIDNVIIENNIKNIEEAAFKNNKMTTLFLNLSQEATISKEAFYNNPLTDVTINKHFEKSYKNFINNNIEVNYLEN